MESSDPAPSHSGGVRRSPPPESSTPRMDTGQRLVDRMPINPKKMAFISTQERFEVPLRPELWPTFAAGVVPASDPHPHTTSPPQQQSNINSRRRNNSVRRQGNPSGVDSGSHARKRRCTTSRSTRGRKRAPDQATRLTDYYPVHGEREVPTRPNRSRQRRHMTGAGHSGRDGANNVQPELPPIHIPRLTDLLSQPLGCLHDRHVQAFQEIFEEFDSTLMENTSAIQVSIGNIVRAPYHLAEKCCPLLEELVHAPRTDDHISVRQHSMSNNGGRHDGNIPDAHGPVQHENTVSSPCAAPQQEACREANNHTSSHTTNPAQLTSRLSDDDDMQRLNSIFEALSEEEDGARSPAVPSSFPAVHDELPLAPPSPHLINQETYENRSTDSDPLHPRCHSHSEDSYAQTAVSTPVVHTTSQVRDCLNSPYHRDAGKRITFKPVRYVSPFKHGILLCPPPDVHQALNLLRYLCADDSPCKSTPIIQFGSTQLSGSDIARSFSNDSLPDPIFMSAFVKCLTDGVIRDPAGKMILTAWKFIQSGSNAEELEALACRDGLVHAAQWCPRNVILESDSRPVVDLLASKNGGRTAIKFIIDEVVEAGDSLPKWISVHRRRESNNVAHELAQLAKRTRHSAIWHYAAPLCRVDHCPGM